MSEKKEELINEILKDAEDKLTELTGRWEARRLLYVFRELELPEKLFEAGMHANEK